MKSADNSFDKHRNRGKIKLSPLWKPTRRHWVPLRAQRNLATTIRFCIVNVNEVVDI